MEEIDSIIEGCKKGDPQMQHELYKRYSPRLYATCCRYIDDDDLAQDALVESFLIIFSTIESYRKDGSLESWMKSIVTHTAITMFRSQLRRRKRESDTDVSALASSPVDLDKQIDVKQALLLSMNNLTPSEKVVFNLVAIEEYTFPEAAELLEENASTVKSRYYKAKEKMQKMMGRYLLH